MTQQPDPADAPPALPALKIVEPEVDAENPWHDDVLDRKEIADRLTSIVRGQEAPFVISLDGRWGTGKTFLLKRWAQDLQNQGFEAIYFNAWEDDFSKDPLLAIIGQLSEHFGEGLLRQMAVGVAEAALNIFTNRLVGMKFDDLTAETLLDDYRDQQATQRAVRERLKELGAKVRDDKDQPLVFIIDELDRCRPTFAIELLERVKHIFDVPNIVFVFGINRMELTKALVSVYGEIEAGEYLRRFFDMEFVLPDAAPEEFCRYLVAKFRLADFFTQVDERRHSPYYVRELSEIAETLPVVMGRLGLSLRDMDYCVRLLALAARESLANQRLYSGVFILLAATKIDDPELYQRFVQGDARGADLINNLNGKERSGAPDAVTASNARSTLNWVEAAAYYSDDPNRALRQLRRLENSEALDEPEYISLELAALDIRDEQNLRRLRDIIRMMREGQRLLEGYESARRSLGQKIDLYFGFVRR